LTQPNLEELSAANAAWSDKTRWDAKWRERVQECLPPIIGLDSTITPPDGGADYTVESRLREMSVDAGPNNSLVDSRGKTIYVNVLASPDQERTIEWSELSPELSKFYAAILPGDKLSQWRALGGNVLLNVSSEKPSRLTPYRGLRD
jgi:hypothetical protein